MEPSTFPLAPQLASSSPSLESTAQSFNVAHHFATMGLWISLAAAICVLAVLVLLYFSSREAAHWKMQYLNVSGALAEEKERYGRMSTAYHRVLGERMDLENAESQKLPSATSESEHTGAIQKMQGLSLR